MIATRTSGGFYSHPAGREYGWPVRPAEGVLKNLATWGNSPRIAVSATGVRGRQRYKPRYKARYG